MYKWQTINSEVIITNTCNFACIKWLSKMAAWSLPEQWGRLMSHKRNHKGKFKVKLNCCISSSHAKTLCNMYIKCKISALTYIYHWNHIFISVFFYFYEFLFRSIPKPTTLFMWVVCIQSLCLCYSNIFYI